MLRSMFLLIAAISFGLGISLPLVRLERLYFFTETPSLINVISGLWIDSNFALSAIILLFSIIFPIAKLFTAFHTTLNAGELPNWITVLGKWSLMDVLLVAILVFAAAAKFRTSALDAIT